MGAIGDYLDGLEDPVRNALQRVTDIAGRAAPDAVEGRSYGMPALLVNGKPLLGFRVAKHHISIFPFSAEVVAAVADDLDGFSVSKGTIRFTADQPLPEEIVIRLVGMRRDEIIG